MRFKFVIQFPVINHAEVIYAHWLNMIAKHALHWIYVKFDGNGLSGWHRHQSKGDSKSCKCCKMCASTGTTLSHGNM